MSEHSRKYTAPNRRYRITEHDRPDSTSYTDYDSRDGPVYVVAADENEDAWIQSTHPVDVEP